LAITARGDERGGKEEEEDGGGERRHHGQLVLAKQQNTPEDSLYAPTLSPNAGCAAMHQSGHWAR
jgi:hypothetical protein